MRETIRRTAGRLGETDEPERHASCGQSVRRSLACWRSAQLNEVLPYSPSCEVSSDNHPGLIARKATDRERLPS